MIFLVEKGKNGIGIVRAYGGDGIVEVPERVLGCPVTEIQGYAFSAHIDRQELEKILVSAVLCREDGTIVSSEEGLPEMAGEQIREIFLPKELRRIGRYAFYNCSNLTKIGFYSKLMDIGAGAFTGCHQIQNLAADVGEKGDSCLKELLSELPEELCVDLWKNGEQGRFWFPEFFEEGVENTPARILENHVHGSGIRYRNCFFHKKLNIREYDKMFSHAKAWENETAVIELALGRALYPMELSGEAKEMYEDYLKKHMTAAGVLLLQKKEYGSLGRILEKLLPTREETGEILLAAEKSEDMEGISLLMDYLHRHTKKQRKVFEL